MGSASRMRIICDPFKKEIEYEWYDFNIEEYVSFDPEKSKLTKEEFVHANIHNSAYEIVDMINMECNVGNMGLEIVFVGTEDDYSDFCDVINTYYNKANIRCIRDDCYFNTAESVLPKIMGRFDSVKSTLDEYSEDEIAKLVLKYNDAVKPSISLCVMGLYSAGKSAFINGIIGEEVLPSDSDPYTAKVYKIYCDKKYQIRFRFDENECILTFEGNTYKPNSSFEKEIIKELQSIVEVEGQHNEIFHMNKALDIINNYKNGDHAISDIIEITIPFINSNLPTEKFDFVIYDTPGSNSDNNVHHFEVLQDSLDEQTNALPVFITTPDTMDAEDNRKILKLIEDTGAALDTTNAIVVVNRSDEKSPEELIKKKEKSQKLKITKWKSTRIFFVSSAIGIGSKKNDPDNKNEWLDSTMFRHFRKNVNDFDSNGDMRLYEFNIVDQSKREIYDLPESAGRLEILHINSGFKSVEREIIEYGRRDALYNKCQQASAYLQDAIDLCVKNVMDTKENLDNTLREAEEDFDLKKKDLCDKLEKQKNDRRTYNTEFQKLMEKDFLEFTEKNYLQEDTKAKHGALQSELREKWKLFKEMRKTDKKDKEWAFSQIQEYVNEKFNVFLDNFSKTANSDMDSFWNEKSNLFKENCKNIVHDSDALTDEQKKILESIVLSKDNMSTNSVDFNLRDLRAIRNKRFLFLSLKRETFDSNKCCKQIVKSFNDVVRTRITYSEQKNNENFKGWVDDLTDVITARLSTFNTGLNTLEQRIKALKSDIEAKKRCEHMLVESKEYIDELLSIQDGGEVV